MVLAILTAVIAPAITDYVDDAKAVKAKEDVEGLGIGMVRLLRDTGFTGLKFTDGTAVLTMANRVDVLSTSAGSVPTFTGATFTSAANMTTSPLQWNTAANGDTFETQLVRNQLATPYAVPTTASRGKGWRGSYIAGPSQADPWGNKYYANTVFFSVATDAAGATEGSVVWTKDVIVVSAGPDGIMQTAIGGTAGGGTGVSTSDDVFYVVQGNTR
jgi:type II secretory pathway pseudopilin PulG